MNLKGTNNLRQRIILLLVAVMLVISAWVAWQQIPFRLAGTAPVLAKVTILDRSVDINFSHTLDPQKTSVKSASFISSYTVDKKTIHVNLSGLDLNEQYTIAVPRATDRSGHTLRDLSFKFTAAKGDESKLSAAQKQKLLQEQQQSKPETVTDSVLQYVPYATLDFRIDPVAEGDKLKLHIQLLLPPNVSGDQENSQIALSKSEAVFYLQSHKIDMNKYTIEYEVVHEELTGH